jgi:(E)-4-hydroxy-3-methylbut-2-enyl-diphosphate synthase
MPSKKQVKVGNVLIGGDAPISIQSMCNTLTKDTNKTIKQIHSLEEEGCEIVRVSVPDKASVLALKEIKKNITIPLVADIHFDYKLGIEAANYVDKVRINPGTIGGNDNLKSVVYAAKNNGIPIRIGLNLGSLEKDIEQKYGLTAEALVESALQAVKFCESLDFYDMVISLKASNVLKTIKAYKLISQKTDYPLHLGITESGTLFSGTIKSSVGIGTLLAAKIGDTIRVSLSADPVEEVKVAKQILQSLELRRFGIEVTSCPTCARGGFDVSSVAREIEGRTSKIKKPLKIAVMGCGVNGPGEAKEADVGVVGGSDKCLLYRAGEIVDKIDKGDIVEKVLGEINNIK